MIKRFLAIGVLTACGAAASDWGDWEIAKQIKETNFLLRQASQEQRYQNYLKKVAYYVERHPDSPPPRPVLSNDPRDYHHDIWLLDQWVEFTRKWEEGKIQKESRSAAQDLGNLPAQPAPSEAELEAAFQQQVVESRAKRDRVYPEALEPNHPIHEEAEKIWKTIKETGHELLNDPDAPFKVYEMAALRLGIKPTGQP